MALQWHPFVRNLMIGAGIREGFANPCAISVYSGTQPRAADIINNWPNYRTALSGTGNTFSSGTATIPTNIDYTSTSYLSAVAYGSGKFVALTYDSIGAATSTDGITWSAVSMPIKANWSSVIFENNTFVAIAKNSNIAATSTDGITWAQRVLPVVAEWSDITFGNGVFVAIANNGNVAITSVDGVTWTQRALPVLSTWVAITFGNGIFVAIANNSTFVATSTDGINWLQRVAPVKLFWTDITFGNGLFVAIATGNATFITSTDGINWNQVITPSGSEWQSISYGNTAFIVVSNVSTNCMTSPDGTNWTVQVLPIGSTFKGLTYGSGKFVTLNTQSSAPRAISITTSAGADAPYLLGHYLGAAWNQPQYGLLLQLAVPPTSTSINTGIATWAILWSQNVTRAQVDSATLPNTQFIVVPVSNDVGSGVIRFADTGFVSNTSKVISDGSLDALM